MIYSMTGFGRAETQLGDYTVTVDVKSLNGKQFDLGTRLPISLKPYEIEIKNILQPLLQRGSVEIFIAMKQHGSSKPMRVNTELAKYYHAALQQISTELNETASNHLQIVMSMPEVVSQSTDELSEADWNNIAATVQTAANKLMAARLQEGSSLEKHLLQTIANIKSLSAAIEPYEAGRAVKQKEKLFNLLSEQAGEAAVDKNRLEQEIIYYLEKFDIAEEKIRLAHHCKYFLDALAEETTEQKGKKLGFILQEIGREINTTGSKANDANIQSLVVQMKDELEKAKEQALNVL